MTDNREQADERIYYKIDPKELIDVCLKCGHKDCADKPCAEYRRVAAELHKKRHDK